jgi:DNA-binding CsgD family transcriptional regulator
VGAGTHDLVGVVEAFYTPGLAADDWLRLVAGNVRSLIDRFGLGIVAGMYSCPDPCSFRPSHALLCDVPEALQEVLFAGLEVFSPIFVADSFLSRTCYLTSEVRGFQEIPTIRGGSAGAAGAMDGLQLNVVEPDGYGCWFGSAQSERLPIPDDLHLTLTRVARHLAAAHRLRRKHQDVRVSADSAEAVLNDRGGVEHATGPAREPPNQARLVRAAHTMDTIRGRRARIDPRDAIKEWQSVVAKRWTLLEHFESDGKRFLLAMDNRAKSPGLELLSEREREVLFQALGGCSNKAVAFQLGLAESTVRVLLARAAAKLRARSRRELLQKVASLTSAPGDGIASDARVGGALDKVRGTGE